MYPSPMRVIAGTFRSRALQSPRGTATRPTSDRLRETLFNILAPRLAGSAFADLYAGTGAVGIEALSRGARHVWFAENAPAALKALHANLSALHITAGYTVDARGVMPLLQKLTQSLDLVFLDPPYESEDAYTQTLGFLGGAAGGKCLHSETLVIAEHATRGDFALADRYGRLVRSRQLKQGDASLSFYRISEP